MCEPVRLESAGEGLRLAVRPLESASEAPHPSGGLFSWALPADLAPCFLVMASKYGADAIDDWLAKHEGTRAAS